MIMKKQFPILAASPPRSNQEIIKTISHHVSNIKKDILSFEDPHLLNYIQGPNNTNANAHNKTIHTLRRKPKLLLALKEKEVGERIEGRDKDKVKYKPMNYNIGNVERIYTPKFYNSTTTAKFKLNKTNIPSDNIIFKANKPQLTIAFSANNIQPLKFTINEDESNGDVARDRDKDKASDRMPSNKASLNPKEYLSILDQLDKDYESSYSKILRDVRLRQLLNEQESRKSNAFNRDNSNFSLSSVDYLQIKKNELAEKPKQSALSNLDYIISKLRNMDYTKLLAKLEKDSALKDKLARMKLSQIENRRHRLVMKLIEKTNSGAEKIKRIVAETISSMKIEKDKKIE